MRIGFKYIFISFFLCIFLIVVFQQCASPAKKTDTQYFLNLSDSVKYVGIEACKGCHADKYHSFLETGMGKSFGPANASRSAADFNQVKPVYDPKVNMYYFPYKKGNDIYIMEYRLNGKDTVHKRIEKISHIVGSGHHTNSHFWSDNGYLFQAPLTWYAQEKRWDLPPGFEISNTRFGRKIDVECMSCHNGMPVVEPGALNKFSKLPAGIDCERCHGPGELHVKEKSNGIVVDTKKTADRSIVNPKRLPWKLQVDICQRCHLQGNNVLRPGKQFTDFKPGMHLDSVFVVFMPVYGSKNVFFMAGHAERLQMSQCFIKSNKNPADQYNPELNLTCITCHDPHVSVRKTNVQKFNNTCINCHQEKGISKLKNCSAPKAEINKTGNNCVSCHMPSNGAADIPHVTVHDHYIRKPGKVQLTDVSQLKPTGLYAVNSKDVSPSMQIEALVSWFEKFDREDTLMKQALKLMDVKTTPSALKIQWSYAQQQYGLVEQDAKNLEGENTSAWTSYRIAKSIDKNQGPEAALEWYRWASEKFKLNADFNAEYANALLRAKKIKESKDLSEKVLKEQAKHVWSLTNLGGCETLLGEYSNAKKHLLNAIALDPDYALAHLYLAEFYTKTGEPALAKAQLDTAKKLDNTL